MCAFCKVHHNMCNLRFWWQWVHIRIYHIFLRYDAVRGGIGTLGRNCCLLLRPRIWVAGGSFRTLIPIYQTTLHHVQEYHLFNIYIMLCKMNKDLESFLTAYFQSLGLVTFKINTTPWILLQLELLISFMLCNQVRILLTFKIQNPNGVQILCCHPTRYNQTIRW